MYIIHSRVPAHIFTIIVECWALWASGSKPTGIHIRVVNLLFSVMTVMMSVATTVVLYTSLHYSCYRSCSKLLNGQNYCDCSALNTMQNNYLHTVFECIRAVCWLPRCGIHLLRYRWNPRTAESNLNSALSESTSAQITVVVHGSANLCVFAARGGWTWHNDYIKVTWPLCIDLNVIHSVKWIKRSR